MTNKDINTTAVRKQLDLLRKNGKAPNEKTLGTMVERLGGAEEITDELSRIVEENKEEYDRIMDMTDEEFEAEREKMDKEFEDLMDDPLFDNL